MRKLLSIAFLLFGLVASANAQIKIEQTFTNDLIIIGNISSGKAANVITALGGGPYANVRNPEHKLYCRIFKDKTTYGILVDTQNRFDDDFEFALGTNIEKAKESLQIILGLMETAPLKTSQTVVDEDGRTIQINLMRRNNISLNAIDVHGKIICNEIFLSRGNLKRAINLLDNKADRKVAKAQARNNEM